MTRIQDKGDNEHMRVETYNHVCNKIDEDVVVLRQHVNVDTSLYVYRSMLLFVSQAEDSIRYHCVTGVQTFALLFSSRRRHTRSLCDWSSDVCSSFFKQKTAYEITV